MRGYGTYEEQLMRRLEEMRRRQAGRLDIALLGGGVPHPAARGYTLEAATIPSPGDAAPEEPEEVVSMRDKGRRLWLGHRPVSGLSDAEA